MRFPEWTKKRNPIERVGRCSFCGEDVNQVGRLISGPGVCICDECVALCNRILEEEGVKPS